MSQEFSFVGQRVPKLDAPGKVTGRTVYGHDMQSPRMLYGKILRSQHAHARILNIDTSRAKALPGVKAILTAEDIPEMKIGWARDNPVLKSGKVRSLRDEIAAVAAVDEDTAQEALELIKVEYEDLPCVFDPEEAMKPGAPIIHDEAPNNIQEKMRQAYFHGDVLRGFADSDVVVEDRFRLPFVTHCCMGTCFVLASFGPSGDLTVWSSTQMPFLYQRDLSTALGLPATKVRVIKAPIGGGFGSKLDMYPFEPICVLLAEKTGCPVRIAFTREEEFIASPTRQPVICDIKSGAKKDGTLTARQVSMILDNGAYSSWGSTTPLVMMQTISSLYRVPNVKYDVVVAYTNNPYSGAMRGYGNPQATFVVESHMDMLAHELGMDPMEFRLKNANQPGDVTGQGVKITTCGLTECIEKAAETVAWTEKRAKPGSRGVGMASMIHVGGGARIYPSDGCGSTLKVDDFGKVTLVTGATDMGQGTDTILAQIVAEELGIPIDGVTVIDSDTDITPWDVGAHASRTAFIAGNSARLAAADAKRQILEGAAENLGERVENLDMKDGRIFRKGEPEEWIPFAKIVRSKHFRPDGNVILAKGWYEPPTERQDKEFRGNISAAYGFATQAVEVEVDTETGEVTVLRIAAAHDVGRAINPMAVEGQIQGGVSMGLGYGLYEELVVQDGEVLNPNFADYALPTAKDMPPIDSIIVETDDPAGPFGAKGMAEPACIPTAPAIANAVYDAVGVRIRELPITPEKVLKALREKEDEAQEGK
ncbi:MAG: molybdopterin-dependent oxidoreductase [Anaerolineae bacterium]|nr:molybdopterin-dependent oxidoreductase [Anaerolineae bacterium]NIN96866.1 molybdopterin-dependent oxidoreductase [Anaerolineae bacterium]NIQ79845.1 molybdopterin-dependent oxidoreductase [Anaerolineae bacterium]